MANGRQTMGTSAYDLRSSDEFAKTRLVRSKNAKKDVVPNATGIRRNVAYTNRDGAAFRVQAAMPGTNEPEASKTQANGRIVSSAIDRSQPAFVSETRTLYR